MEQSCHLLQIRNSSLRRLFSILSEEYWDDICRRTFIFRKTKLIFRVFYLLEIMTKLLQYKGSLQRSFWGGGGKEESALNEKHEGKMSEESSTTIWFGRRQTGQSYLNPCMAMQLHECRLHCIYLFPLQFSLLCFFGHFKSLPHIKFHPSAFLFCPNSFNLP